MRVAPESGLLPSDVAERALCRSICGEMQSGFSNLRSGAADEPAGPLQGLPGLVGARGADLDRIEVIWSERLGASGGPFLFGDRFTVADAMYAPVCTRVRTYDVKLGPAASAYVERILELPEMLEWTELGSRSPRSSKKLDMEF